MEITLEKIELVKDRTGVGYKEAKEALEQTEGSVVDAIILIEDNIDAAGKAKMSSQSAAVVEAIKEAIRKGNVSKLCIKKDGEILINLPVNIGIIGTVLFPWAAIGATIAALGTKCQIDLVKDNGEIVDVSELAGKAFDTAKSKGGVIMDEMKDKGGDFVNVAKEKGADVYDSVKEKAADVMKKTAETGEELKSFGEFDLSDLDLSKMDSDEEDPNNSIE